MPCFDYALGMQTIFDFLELLLGTSAMVFMVWLFWALPGAMLGNEVQKKITAVLRGEKVNYPLLIFQIFLLFFALFMVVMGISVLFGERIL